MMPKAVCPACGKTLHGWSIEYLDRMPCPYCGKQLSKEELQRAENLADRVQEQVEG